MNASRLNPVDLALFVRAMLLARRAQRVRTKAIPAVVAELCARSGSPRIHAVKRLSLAADRAASRWARWFGGLDTCLTRSLILGALLVGRENVVLNVGFRHDEDQDSGLAGHAWVTLHGRPVGSDGHLAETSYTQVLEVPYGESKNG